MTPRARTWPLQVFVGFGLVGLGLLGLLLTLRWVGTARLDQRSQFAYHAAEENGLFVVGIPSVTAPEMRGRWPVRPPASPSVFDVVSYGAVAYGAVGGETLAVFDLRDPAAPDLRDVVKAPDFFATRVEVALGLATVLDPEQGVRIFDVGDPFFPKLLGSLEPRRGEVFSAMSLQPPLLYVVGNQGLRIAHLNDPSEPVPVSEIGAGAEILDLVVVQGTAYLVGADSMAIVDVGDPREPKLLGGLGLRTKNAVAIAFADVGAGRWVYVGKQVPPTGGSAGLRAINVDDPEKPVLGESIEEDISFLDLVVEDRLLHVAAGASGHRIYDLSDGAPGFMGQTSTQWPMLRLSLQADLPEATATPRPSPTTAPTQTLTPRATLTLTPTRVAPTASPTHTPPPRDTATAEPEATITRVRPPTPTPTPRGGTRATATAVPPERWAIPRPPLDVAAALDRVQSARFDTGGTLWLRLPAPTGGGEDLVISREGDQWRRYGSLREVLRARYDDILARGTLPDFWATDDAGRVWVGPTYFDGRNFTQLAVDEQTPAGSLTYDPRTVIDRDGRAWVPYRSRVSCPNPAGCRKVAVRLLNPEGGVELDVEVDGVQEAGEYGVPEVMLLHSPKGPGRGGDVVAKDGGDFAERKDLGDRSSADRGQGALAETAQTDDQSYVVTSRAFYVPPSTEAIPYPLLDELGEAQRNAGYATSSTVDPEGRPVVVTWIEEHVGEAPRTLQWRVLANTWTGIEGAEWQTQELSDSPVFAAGLEFLRGTAVAFAPDGSLWLGSSEGEVAVWREGAWDEHFTSDNSPLPAGQPITGITISGTGTVWCVTPSGVYTYEAGGEGPARPTIYLPFAQQKK